MEINNIYNEINEWTLNVDELNIINDLIKNGSKRFIEFGSGLSTKYIESFNNIEIISFDNDVKYSHKSNNVHIKNIIECDDKIYEYMFINKLYNKNLFVTKSSPINTRQRNCFYDVNENDLNGIYDVVIIDGPHGNGRSIAFLYVKNHIKIGTYFLIDDLNHYDFEERLKMVYDVETIIINTTNKNYGLFKVINIL